MLPLQSSEHNRTLDDLDEEENHVLPPVEESQATRELQEDVHGPPQVIRCGGEDGENGGRMSQRQRLNADMRDSSSVRRGRGKTVLIESLYFKNQRPFLRLTTLAGRNVSTTSQGDLIG